MSNVAGSAFAMLCLGLPLAAFPAGRSIHETRAAPAQGTVEIINAAGTIEVRGWDAAQIDVSGTAGEKVERVELMQSGDRTTVRVVRPRQLFSYGEQGDARLLVQIPRGSALVTEFVSSDLVTTGVVGRQTLHSVSGDLRGDAAAPLEVKTVSGDAQFTAHQVSEARLESTSGDLRLSGAGGNVRVQTVSGDLTLELDRLDDGHFETVSGDQRIVASLATVGRLSAHAVSGDVHIELKAPLDAEIAAQSLSGDISNCTPPAAEEPAHGPGSHLNYRSGNGGGAVRVETTSGDISLCAR